MYSCHSTLVLVSVYTAHWATGTTYFPNIIGQREDNYNTYENVLHVDIPLSCRFAFNAEVALKMFKLYVLYFTPRLHIED